MVNQGFRDLFAEFNAHSVDYVVVGAFGHVRATQDLDGGCGPKQKTQSMESVLTLHGKTR